MLVTLNSSLLGVVLEATTLEVEHPLFNNYSCWNARSDRDRIEAGGRVLIHGHLVTVVHGSCHRWGERMAHRLKRAPKAAYLVGWPFGKSVLARKVAPTCRDNVTFR